MNPLFLCNIDQVLRLTSVLCTIRDSVPTVFFSYRVCWEKRGRFRIKRRLPEEAVIFGQTDRTQTCQLRKEKMGFRVPRQALEEQELLNGGKKPQETKAQHIPGIIFIFPPCLLPGPTN